MHFVSCRIKDFVLMSAMFRYSDGLCCCRRIVCFTIFVCRSNFLESSHIRDIFNLQALAGLTSTSTDADLSSYKKTLSTEIASVEACEL